MAASKLEHELRDSSDMNMTPMIDIVFQLIIFFMIAVDLSQRELEDLVLPISKMATDDEPEEGRLVVNINRRGEYTMFRRSLSLRDLERELKVRVDLPYVGQRVRGFREWALQPILIRADQAADFKYVQKLIDLCGQAGIKIWKIELAGSQAGATSSEAER